jgi:hypothetical protein
MLHDKRFTVQEKISPLARLGTTILSTSKKKRNIKEKGNLYKNSRTVYYFE